MNRDFPVGKAQQMVLDALKLRADGFNAADALFNNLGMAVTGKRQGRASVPEIRLESATARFNADGDADTIPGHVLTQSQYDAIRQWVVEE